VRALRVVEAFLDLSRVLRIKNVFGEEINEVGWQFLI
jgi:hypothetical protein